MCSDAWGHQCPGAAAGLHALGPAVQRLRAALCRGAPGPALRSVRPVLPRARDARWRAVRGRCVPRGPTLHRHPTVDDATRTDLLLDQRGVLPDRPPRRRPDVQQHPHAEHQVGLRGLRRGVVGVLVEHVQVLLRGEGHAQLLRPLQARVQRVAPLDVPRTTPTRIPKALSARQATGGVGAGDPRPNAPMPQACAFSATGDESKSRAIVNRFVLMSERKSPQPKTVEGQNGIEG